MDVGILFWFYKDIDVCIDRASHLRRLNPHLKIYGLYGGDLNDAALYENSLKPFLDDFYVFPEGQSHDWKWLNGDQMIVRWFAQRGHSLPWGTIFIAQWDLLLLAPLSRLLQSLKPDQLLLPGLRPIRDVKNWWRWVCEKSMHGKSYEDFINYYSEINQLPIEPLCCNFITAALPRRFLERYQNIPNPELGFLEYKLPIYAQHWGFSFCTDHPFQPTWLHEKYRNRIERYWITFHAEKRPISTGALLVNALLPWGKRVFHPYIKVCPALLKSRA